MYASTAHAMKLLEAPKVSQIVDTRFFTEWVRVYALLKSVDTNDKYRTWPGGLVHTHTQVANS